MKIPQETKIQLNTGFFSTFQFTLPLLSTIGIYMFKVNNRNTRTRCEICSKLTIETPEQRLEHLNLVFLLLTFSR